MRLEVPGILHPVIDCLDKFKKVVEGCFSWTLAPDFKERIEDFSQNYTELISYAKVSLCIYIYYLIILLYQVILEEKLTVTWKVHSATTHLSSFFTIHGRGMADICDQVHGCALEINTHLSNLGR